MFLFYLPLIYSNKTKKEEKEKTCDMESSGIRWIIMACCISLNCPCKRFTKSAFTGFDGRDCSGCGHNKEYHFSFLSGTSLSVQIRLIKSYNEQVLSSELARAISLSVKPSKKFIFFTEDNVNFLNLLPRELLVMVCQYINESSDGPVGRRKSPAA